MKEKSCKNCNACKILYEFVRERFWSRNLIYCTERENVTERNYTCGKWQERKVEFDFSAERFNLVEEDIHKLSKLLRRYQFIG